MSGAVGIPYLTKSSSSSASTIISPKISQLHQIYNQHQQPKMLKQHRENHDVQNPSENNFILGKFDEVRIPKRIIISPNGKPRQQSAQNLVNSKFESLSLNQHQQRKTDDNKVPRELNLENVTSKLENDSIIDIDQNIGKVCAKDCVSISRKAFQSGRTKKFTFRDRQLKGLLKFLENHQHEIEEALFKDLRKHKQETNISEIELVANDLRHTIIKLRQWMDPEKPTKRLVNILDNIYVYNDPYGVILIIGAWNYPILLTLGPLVGALAGGNSVILKPSELAPATNKLLIEVLTNYLDSESFQIYTGGAQETTELLKERFDYIFFTGSTKIGQIVYQAAANNLTPCTLELGGKCPLYIDNTTDMHKTAKRVLWGKMMNSGQTCVAPDYILCTKEVQEKFIKEARKVINQFWADDPSKSECLSRIVSERHYKRLLEFMISEQIAVGGQINGKDLIIGPTILTDVSPHSSVMEEEIFGPILPIITINNCKEAIEFINSREKPLALYVFSNNKKIHNMFISKTSSGGLCINDTVSHIGTENLPFGGVGLSGLGNYHGKHGFDTFTHQKGVLVKDFSNISEIALSIRYPPYSEKKTQLINTILKRRSLGIPLGYLNKVFIFALGVGLAFLLQYYLNII